MRGVALLFVMFIGALSAAGADPLRMELGTRFASAEKLGESDVRYWGFDLYSAELWATDRTPLDFDGPFALALTYKREFTARDLSGASVDEIARMTGGDVADHAALGPLLEDCFADVAYGDRITGISETRDTAAFLVNGRESCAVDYPDFSSLFFGIWLGEKARDPRVRDRLLGRRE